MTAGELVSAYAASGLAVLPLHAAPYGRCTCGRQDCTSPGKHPRTGNGKDDATTDLGQIAEWLARWPGCNWGARPPAGIVVLDVDPRHGGATQLLELQRAHGALPPTLTARTGGGGVHAWYAYRGPTRGQLARGIDIKTNTGYLVVPPSVHACGVAYEWVDPDATTAPAPSWLRHLLAPPQAPRRTATRVPVTGDRKLAGLVRTVAEAPQGSRNGRLFWAACRATEAGLDVAPLIDAAIAAGLPADEAERTAASATRRSESA